MRWRKGGVSSKSSAKLREEVQHRFIEHVRFLVAHKVCYARNDDQVTVGDALREPLNNCSRIRHAVFGPDYQGRDRDRAELLAPQRLWRRGGSLGTEVLEPHTLQALALAIECARSAVVYKFKPQPGSP